MNNLNSTNVNIVDHLYRENYTRILNYISTRVKDAGRAEDLAQDVWVRVLTGAKELVEETAISYLYTIARNLVNDYLRSYYVGRGAEAGLEECREEASDVTADSAVITIEIENLEIMRVERLPKQRRIIYRMCRFEGKSVHDIAEEMSLSTRTIENHLHIGRQEVRRYIAAAV